MDKEVLRFLMGLGLRANATEEQAQAFLDNLSDNVQAQCRRISEGLLTVEDAQRGASPHVVHPPSTPATPPVSTNNSEVDGAAAERARTAAIYEIAGNDVPAEMVRTAITDGTEAEAFRAQVLNHVREQRSAAVPAGGAPNINRASEVNSEVLSTALALRGGIDYRNIHIDGLRGEELESEQARRANQAEAYIDMSLLDTVREAIIATGGNVGRGRREILDAAANCRAVGDIFTSAVGAVITAGFDLAPSNARQWCEQADAPDFKERDLTTVNKAQGMTRTPRGTEAEHTYLDADVEKARIIRYSEQMTIDEQDIIDDRLDVFARIPQMLGEDAAQLEDDAVVALLLSNPTLNSDGIAVFDASTHANLSSNALNETNLLAGLTAMAKQTYGGRPLNIRAAHLHVPQDLSFTAQKLVSSAEILQKGDTDATYGTRNVIADQNLRVMPEARLGAAGCVNPVNGAALTGSTTNWFLTAARRAVLLEFLQGSGRRPVTRSSMLTQGRFGINIDIKHDIGASWQDYRGAYKGGN